MPLQAEDCAVTYKVLILGDDSVGKSALLDCLMGRSFKKTMYPTIGVDFVRKIFEVDGALVQLAIWDTAGQERFRSITRLQYKGVQGLILVYDVTNVLTFKTLKYWIHSIQTEISRPGGSYEPVPMILCGNKSDLIRQKKVSTAEGQKMANREMAFGFYETSAQTGDNVYSAFQDLAFHITDICNPKLMKSYHPHSIRPLSDPDPTLNQDTNLRHFKAKAKFRFRNGNSSQPPPKGRQSWTPSSSKGDHSTEPNSLGYPPWEDQSLEESSDYDSPKWKPAAGRKTSSKTKRQNKNKKKTANKDIAGGAKPPGSVFQRTLGCLLCTTTCMPRKSRKKRNKVV